MCSLCVLLSWWARLWRLCVCVPGTTRSRLTFAVCWKRRKYVWCDDVPACFPVPSTSIGIDCSRSSSSSSPPKCIITEHYYHDYCSSRRYIWACSKLSEAQPVSQSTAAFFRSTMMVTESRSSHFSATAAAFHWLICCSLLSTLFERLSALAELAVVVVVLWFCWLCVCFTFLAIFAGRHRSPFFLSRRLIPLLLLLPPSQPFHFHLLCAPNGAFSTSFPFSLSVSLFLCSV